MFEALTDQFGSIFDRIRGKAIIREGDLKQTLAEIRLALLDADVALPVVKEFLAKVGNVASGADVLKSVNPDQMIIKIVHDQLVELLGGDSSDSPINLAVAPPAVVMMVGLQGTGKTTSCAKLALHLRDKLKKKVLLVSLDTARPAAQHQLEVLAQQIEVTCLPIVEDQQPSDIARRALNAAQLSGHDVVILDTAGRLQIDTALMQEVAQIQSIASPCETLLVADALSGQNTLSVAEKFHQTLNITGVILSRMDGDSRGGVALSLRAATGAPLKFLGTGESVHDLEAFHPDRLARRILGMGDVVSLVEKAREQVSEVEAKDMAKRLQKGQFDMNDLTKQLAQMRKMGGMSGIMGMLPGVGKLKKQMAGMNMDDRQLVRQESIIGSMTKQERRRPDIIHASRKKRIAQGAGVTVQEVNKLLKQFMGMQKMMKKMRQNKSLPNFSAEMGADFDPSSIDMAQLPPEMRDLLPRNGKF